MEFSRQEYWSWLPFPPPGDPTDPGIEPASPKSPVLQADSLPLREVLLKIRFAQLEMEIGYEPFHALPKESS